MKRPLAYLTAAWSGEPDVDMELAATTAALLMRRAFPRSARSCTCRCF